MAQNPMEWLIGNNNRAVSVLERNHSLSGFIAKVVFNFEQYCREKGINPYTARIGDAIISREGQIVAKIER